MYVNSKNSKTLNGDTPRQRISNDLIADLEETAVAALKEEYRYEFDTIDGDKTMPTSEKIHKQRQAMLVFVGGIILVKLLAAVI